MTFKIKKIFKLLSILIIFFILLNKQNKNIFYINNEINAPFSNNYNILINNNDSIDFNITEIKFYFSVNYKMVKIKYKILFFDKNNNFILPSDLTLLNNLNLICIMKIINENIDIYSFPNIHQNKYYECIEFININEKIKFGIKIYQTKENKTKINSIQAFFFLEKKINYKILNNNKKELFEPLILIKEYIRFSKILTNINLNETLKLKKSYTSFPINCLKREIAIYENIWYFRNINNIYFCFCKGQFCFENNIYQKCKYQIYLNIIDKNRKVYKKEHYFFLDFVFEEYSYDDVYPIFKKMINDKKLVHYFTENMNIFNEYCNNKNKCFKIIYVNKNNYTINGDFIEKYLTLILKLKIVISGAGINIFYMNNLFYNIEYITYICIGHGISFFKDFLYNSYDWYGHKIFDKILIPPSNKLISVVKMHGWKDENIIKMNLPRWDKFNFNSFYKNDSYINNNSIFVMFTWRKIKKDKKISFEYFKNIFNLINNDKLYLYLKSNNIVLYFILHHKLHNFIYKFKKYKYIFFIKELMISDCLSKINLLISDFSSIIFDAIYRRKPYIMYIPDAYDKEIENIYERTYYELIQSLKNDTIYFENKFFTIAEVVNKIIFYINNNFMLEPQLEKFYDLFDLKKGNNTNKFIKYITAIK